MMNFFEYLPPFIFIFIGFVIMIQISLKFNSRNKNKDFEEYIEAEIEANKILKKEINEKYFFYPNIQSLPIKEYKDSNELKNLQDDVIHYSSLKMVRFDKKHSNLELKKIFGVNNLNKIIDYEEHFNMFIVSLNDWSKALIKKGKYQEAEKVLQETLKFGSDYFQTYSLLIDTYTHKKSLSKINALKHEIENKDFGDNISLKNRILNYSKISLEQ